MPIQIVVEQHGGPEVLSCNDRTPAPPADSEVQIEQKAIGLNFIDTYLRTGLYPPPQLPFTPGFEAAGIVTAVGEQVEAFAPGDRVAYSNVLGAYASVRNVPAERLLHLPLHISFEQAAAMMMKAMTAEFLLHRTYAVKPGDTILVHAAAGGVGSLLCRWAAHIGASVIGTVGSDEKAARARNNGCHHAIVYRHENFAERIRDITGGRGVDVVYDSVGQTTFKGSLQSLKPFGLLVAFGQSSGKIPPFDIGELMTHGSLYLTRPTLMHHIADRASLEAMGERIFNAVRDGVLEINIAHRYDLMNVQQAHRDLEARKTSGSVVLLP